MLEIINDVLKAETEAETLITKAKEESLRHLAAFDQEEREKVQGVQSEQSERVALRIPQIRRDAEEASHLREKEIREKADRFLEDQEEALNDVAGVIIRLVLESQSIKQRD